MGGATWPPECDVAGALATLRDDGQGDQALADLLCFRHLKKWTVALFAARWAMSEDTARRAMRRLHARGLLGCLQGEARAARGAHHGGRGADVWFLTPRGARVLSAHLGPDPADRVRAPPPRRAWHPGARGGRGLEVQGGHPLVIAEKSIRAVRQSSWCPGMPSGTGGKQVARPGYSVATAPGSRVRSASARRISAAASGTL